ncbi:MAG TPA: hypothetical protein VF335_02825, partial [Chitinivibrionales bacterium]
RLVMELKGKLFMGNDPERGAVAASHNPHAEAFDALLSLGYAEKQVGSALTRVESIIDANAPVEEWIKKALQVI